MTSRMRSHVRGSAPWIIALLLILGVPVPAFAQRRVRYEQDYLKNAPALLETAAQLAGPASAGTVRVLAEEEPVALGTVIREDGYILTKASELQDDFEVELADGRRVPGQILGVLKEHDLAAIKVDVTGLAAVKFSTSAVNNATAGQWLASTGVGEQVVLKVGNLSVQGLRRIPSNGSLLGVMLGSALAGIPVHRVDPGGAADRAGLESGDVIVAVDGAPVGSMRDLVRFLRNGPPGAGYELTISRAGSTRRHFITLLNGQAGLTLVTEAVGVPVASVTPDSGAAAAGILPGDVILALDDRTVRDRVELTRLIRAYKPGESVSVTFLRAGDELSVDARLGYSSGRSIRGDFQNQLGTHLSARAVDFPAVLQHDSILNANQMGGPVVDLRGEVLGINIARAGRVETYALPAQVIEAAIPELLSGRLPTATAPAVTESGAPPADPAPQE